MSKSHKFESCCLSSKFLSIGQTILSKFLSQESMNLHPCTLSLRPLWLQFQFLTYCLINKLHTHWATYHLPAITHDLPWYFYIFSLPFSAFSFFIYQYQVTATCLSKRTYKSFHPGDMNSST